MKVDRGGDTGIRAFEWSRCTRLRCGGSIRTPPGAASLAAHSVRSAVVGSWTSIAIRRAWQPGRLLASAEIRSGGTHSPRPEAGAPRCRRGARGRRRYLVETCDDCSLFRSRRSTRVVSSGHLVRRVSAIYARPLTGRGRAPWMCDPERRFDCQRRARGRSRDPPRSADRGLVDAVRRTGAAVIWRATSASTIRTLAGKIAVIHPSIDPSRQEPQSRSRDGTRRRFDYTRA